MFRKTCIEHETSFISSATSVRFLRAFHKGAFAFLSAGRCCIHGVVARYLFLHPAMYLPRSLLAEQNGLPIEKQLQ